MISCARKRFRAPLLLLANSFTFIVEASCHRPGKQFLLATVQSNKANDFLADTTYFKDEDFIIPSLEPSSFWWSRWTATKAGKDGAVRGTGSFRRGGDLVNQNFHQRLIAVGPKLIVVVLGVSLLKSRTKGG